MSSPAISSNGYVYIGSTNGRVYCLYENNGTMKWDYNTGAEIVSSPALTDNHVIIGSKNGYLYCFGPEFPTHDVAVLNVTISPTTINPGDTVNITYTVRNNGNHAETFNVTCAYNYTNVWTAPLYNDTILICSETVTLGPGAELTKNCTWNTTGVTFKSNKYTISVQARTSVSPPEPEETYTQDNTFMDGLLTILGVEVHDVAVLSVVPSNTTAYPTWSPTLNVTVVVQNEGTVTETFNVTLYYDPGSIIIGTYTVVDLDPDAQTTITFHWNINAVPAGNYTLWAVATLSGDTDPGDNTKIDDVVDIKFPGDADESGFVDVSDFAILGYYWFNVNGYDPRADFDGSGFIDVSDFAVLGYYWFQGP